MSSMEQTGGSLLQQAQDFQDAGKLAEAEKGFREVIASAGDADLKAEAYDGLAAVLQDQGKVDEAVAASLSAAEIRQDAEATYLLGITLMRLGKLDGAITAFGWAGKWRPELGAAHGHRGELLLKQGKVAEAVESFAAAVAAETKVAEHYSNLAVGLRELGKQDEALKAVRQAIELKPELAEAHNTLGALLRDRRRPADAAAAFMAAGKARPDFPEAINNLGSVLEHVGKDATAFFRRAVELSPNSYEMHMNLGMELLLQGEFAEGFSQYEWRRMGAKNPSQRNFGKPQWDGSALNGKTVLLYAEQGIGDTLQFCRYTAKVGELSGKIVIEAQPALLPLLRELPFVTDVVLQGKPWPAFDVHAPLMSLPALFKTTMETIPAAVPYLKAPVDRLEKWRGKLPARAKAKRIGLVWAGNVNFKDDWRRSIAASKLAPLAELKRVEFVSLQKEPRGTPDLKMIDITSQLGDFADTAAVIEQLDLTICVDTAVAHLAGAMGKPVWLLLPANADWRWMLKREDSPWYPTMRLFRQDTAGDWGGVITRVVKELGMMTVLGGIER